MEVPMIRYLLLATRWALEFAYVAARYKIRGF